MDTQEGNMNPVPGVAIGISYKCALGDGKEMVLQTHVDSETPLPALNAVLDKLRMASERQAAYGDLVQLEQALQQHQNGLQNALEQQAKLEARQEPGRRGPAKLSVADQKAKENFDTSMDQFKKMIERIQADIGKTKAKIEG